VFDIGFILKVLIIIISNKKDDDDNNKSNNNNSNTKLHVDMSGCMMISAVFNSTIFFGYEKLKW